MCIIQHPGEKSQREEVSLSYLPVYRIFCKRCWSLTAGSFCDTITEENRKMGYTEKKDFAYRLNAAARKNGICRGNRGLEQRCHSEPVRRLVWESPSNSRLLIVIQIVLLHRFPESGCLLSKSGCVYPGDCHASLRTGSQRPGIRQIPICAQKNDTERRRARTTTQIWRTTWPSALPPNSNLPSC